MKKSIFFAFSLIFCILLFGNAIYAKDLMEVKVKNGSDFIEIQWSGSADHYSLYKPGQRDNQLIWTGNEKKYMVSNLEPNNIYKFNIVAYDQDGNMIDFVKIHTFTLGNEENTKADNQTISNSRVQSIVYNDRIEISWDKVPDDDLLYEVYKDDKLIGSELKNKYVDYRIKPDKNYVYKIIGKKKRSERSISEIKGKLKNNKIKLTSNMNKYLNDETFNVIHNVQSLRSNVEKNLAGFEGSAEKVSQKRPLKEQVFNSLASIFSASKASADMIYQPGYALVIHAWIPMDKVILPYMQYSSFHGDNRIYPDLFTKKYRTKMEQTMIFKGGSNITFGTPVRDVNPTIGYSWWGGSDTKTASNSGMYSNNVIKSTDKISFQVHHQAANPLVGIAPPIEYNYTATVYSSGSFSISGTHTLSPSISIYITTYPGDSFYNAYFNHSLTGSAFAAGLLIDTNFYTSG